MHGMYDAVNRILRAIKDNERIAVYGDFDADGQTSTAVLMEGLGRLGFLVDFYIPQRMSEGHGLNIEGLKTVTAAIVVTCDCGVADHEAIAFAQAIACGEPSPVPAEESLQVIQILDGIYRSQETGAEIILD